MGHLYLNSSSTGILAVKELMEIGLFTKERGKVWNLSVWNGFLVGQILRALRELGSTDVVVLRLGMILTTGSLSYSAVVF